MHPAFGAEPVRVVVHRVSRSGGLDMALVRDSLAQLVDGVPA